MQHGPEFSLSPSTLKYKPTQYEEAYFTHIIDPSWLLPLYPKLEFFRYFAILMATTVGDPSYAEEIFKGIAPQFKERFHRFKRDYEDYQKILESKSDDFSMQIKLAIEMNEAHCRKLRQSKKLKLAAYIHFKASSPYSPQTTLMPIPEKTIESVEYKNLSSLGKKEMRM